MTGGWLFVVSMAGLLLLGSVIEWFERRSDDESAESHRELMREIRRQP